MEFRLPLCTPPIAAPLPQKETRSWTQWISSQPTYILYKTYRCIHTHICISLETHNIVYVGFWHLRKQHRTVFCPAIFFTYHCFWAPFKSRLMSLLYQTTNLKYLSFLKKTSLSSPLWKSYLLNLHFQKQSFLSNN